MHSLKTRPTTLIAKAPRWSLLAGTICLLTQVVWAEVRITGIFEDEQLQSLNTTSSQSVRNGQTLTLSSRSQNIGFTFNETNAAGQPSARLRYKLEGYEDQWQDLSASTEMRMTLQFLDSDNRILDIVSFDMKGETEGWRGGVETSDYQSRRGQATAPARTTHVWVVLVSQGPPTIIGLAGVDAVRLRIEPLQNGGTAAEYDLSVKEGTDLNEPMGSPANWVRQGSRAGMSQLGTRLEPSPHPVLVLNDQDARRFSTWVSGEGGQEYPVQPGDRVTLEWHCAHSIGRAGPGRADYATLKPGRYWFRVAAAKANGDLTEDEVSMRIDIVPPLTRRWEFWLPVGCLAVVSGILLCRTAQRRRMERRLAEVENLHALERERSRIARDLHDDIGAGLTEIAIKSDLVRGDLKEHHNPETRRRIDRVCQSAMELTRSVDEIVWAVNPVNDTLPHFVNYLTHSTEQFLEATQISVRFDIQPELPALALSGKNRHLIYLAFREALNNAVKHAQATLIRLETKLEAKTLRLVVEDNGCGFAPDQVPSPGPHEGIEGMRRRLKEIGGRLVLTSRPGTGTRIEFIVPLG